MPRNEPGMNRGDRVPKIRHTRVAKEKPGAPERAGQGRYALRKKFSAVGLNHFGTYSARCSPLTLSFRTENRYASAGFLIVPVGHPAVCGAGVARHSPSTRLAAEKRRSGFRGRQKLALDFAATVHEALGDTVQKITRK
jgi:hypothetical protein